MTATMLRAICCLAILFATVSPSRAGVVTEKGIVTVDDHTFPKVAAVPLHQPIFLRLDQGHPAGPAADAFKELGRTIGGASTNVLLLSAPISEWDGEVETDVLAASYKVTPKKGLPKFMLLPMNWDGNPSSAIEYKGKHKASVMQKWLSKKTGQFIGMAGQTRELDKLAAEFMKDGADRDDLIVQFQLALDKSHGSVKGYAEYYLKVAEKVMDDQFFISKEIERLNGLLRDKSVPKGKKDSIHTRLNIMASFAMLHRKTRAG